MTNQPNKNETSIRRHCCVIDCEKQAEWEIVDGHGPDDFTDACTAHVGELLSDAPEQKIYPLRGK